MTGTLLDQPFGSVLNELQVKLIASDQPIRLPRWMYRRGHDHVPCGLELPGLESTSARVLQLGAVEELEPSSPSRTGERVGDWPMRIAESLERPGWIGMRIANVYINHNEVRRGESRTDVRSRLLVPPR